jgi:LuxR family maltose regulon positive regulatory protein
MPISKITCPKVIDVIQRKRLYSLLDVARKKPITWIAGPGGSGKTTLVTDYINRHKLPHLWYQLDEGDADVPTFFYYLGLAARKASPLSRKPLPLLTPEYLHGIHIFSRSFFENLYARLKPHSILVFDNYQDVSFDSGFHQIISEGIASVPDGLRIILISRFDPPPAFTRLRANNMISYVGWDDLKLTAAETRLFAYSRGRTKVTKATMGHFLKTDGWVAGLVLMTEGTSEITPIVQGLEIPNRKEIFNYFATEVFEKSPSETQELFMKTALFSKITANATRSLTGIDKADHILQEMTRQNFFTTKYGRYGEAYQYHRLFREFLLARLGKTYSLKEMESLKRKAAHVLAEDGQGEDAVVLFLQSEDFLEAARLICGLAPSMLSQGRSLVVEKWVDALPPDVIEQNPWLLYWRGACKMPFSPSESKKEFDKAFELFEAQGHRAGMFLSWCGSVDDAFFGNDLRSLDRMITLLEKMLMTNSEFPSPEIAASVTVSMFGALRRRRPQHADVCLWEKKSLGILSTDCHLYLRCKAGAYLISNYLRTGDFAKASSALEVFRKAVKSETTPDLVKVTFKSVETLYTLVTDSCENYRDLVFETIKLGDKTGIRVWETLVIGHGIAAALSNGDLSTADALINKIKPDTDTKERLDGVYYHFAKTWKAMIEQDDSTAQQHCQELMHISKLVGDIPSIAMSHIMAYEMLRKKGRKREAEGHLSSAYKIADETKSSFTEYMCLIVESYIAYLYEEAKGIDLLRKVMALGREKNFTNTYWWRPAVMASLCAKALDAGIEVDYVQSVIRKRKLAPDADALLVESWPYPLRIYTLGKFEIVAEGKPVLFTRKIQQRPISLLKALIAFGGKAVPEGELTDVLWPDVDGYSAHRSFELALYRLRKLLGNEKAVQFKDGYLTLEEQYCFVDVWGIQRVIKKIEEGWKKNQQTEIRKKNKKERKELKQIVRLTERVLDSYKGHFLDGDISQPWIISLRELLRSKIIYIIVTLGRHWEEAELYDKSAECFRRGLEIDDVREVLYQRLMISYHKLGRDAEAATIYHRCRSRLKAALNLTPSLITEEIYQSIRTHRQN